MVAFNSISYWAHKELKLEIKLLFVLSLGITYANTSLKIFILLLLMYGF